MKKLAMAALLVMAVAQAQAASGYLGTDDQAVHLNHVATTTVQGTVDTNATIVNVPTVTVSGSVAVTGSVNATVVNPVLVTSSNTVIKDAGGDALAINADGSINTSITLSSGTASITSYQAPASTYVVRDVSQPSLENKFAVAASSNDMVTSGVISITGVTKSIDLLAVAGACTFTINDGGGALIVAKNTSESYDYAFTLVNGSVTLNAKDGGATCKARIKGAN